LDELDDMSADTWDQNLDQFALGDISTLQCDDYIDLGHKFCSWDGWVYVSYPSE